MQLPDWASKPDRASRGRLLGLILVLAAVLRLWSLDFGLPHLLARPDETEIVGRAVRFFGWDLNPRFFHYPSFFFYLLGAVYAVWIGALALSGQALDETLAAAALDLSPYIVMGRAVSAIAGVLTVAVVYRLGRSLGGTGVGLAIAEILAHAGARVTVMGRTEADLRLCHFVETTHGFPAIEDVLSGRGLERVYRWHATEAGLPAERSAAEIMAACGSGDDPVANDTVQTFIRILGTVCGNLALVHLPFGGVYLVGGVARAMAPHFQTFGFADAFRDKGRFAGFMQNFAVNIVEDDYAALIGLISHLEN